ncbi:MAG: NAD(P)/FAD-dependent oxidoreductase [Bacilli bacterium]|nr:NAD(P)/FAD-dependent oxidoreductase [Bacilli bacterium]
MKYDVIIVGAGPAGLFAAYELITQNTNLKIAVMDKGFRVKKRMCPMNKNGIPCQNCNPCAILAGYGGAGTFSDGKLNFIPTLGKSDLTKYMTESEANKLIDETEKIFNKFKMDAQVYPSNMDEANQIKKKVAIAGAKLLIIKQKHLGSDHLPEYIDGICDYLVEKGVDLYDKTDVKDINTVNKNEHEVIYNVGKKENILRGKKIIVAPGRTGAKWIQELADKNNIPYLSQSIEIGVRVEVRKEIMQEITDIIYDPTIFIKTKTYGDEIRTFCTNPGGFVAKENYYGFICVNGHALKEIKSNNTNFAFISKVHLTEPVTNTRLYGESIARIANVLGDGKPIIQSLKDLKNARRSEWHRLNKGFVEPTLKDCVAGDLALVLPHRIISNILEGLETLDKIIPGVANDDTLLYGPEIKFFSNEVETNNNFKLENDNIYFIGDGAGKAGNIVTAAATGLVAARDILKEVKTNEK